MSTGFVALLLAICHMPFPGGFAAGAGDRSPATSSLLLSDFRQQGAKAGLYEMPIARERLADSLFLHDDKGNAVGERPILVGPGSVEIEAFLKMLMRSLDDGHARMAVEKVKQSKALLTG